MRTLSICLVIILVSLQYKLWKGDRGIFELIDLHQKHTSQLQINKKLVARNQALYAEIVDLRSGDHALEEQARTELGMIKKGEVYYQFVEN